MATLSTWMQFLILLLTPVVFVCGEVDDFDAIRDENMVQVKQGQLQGLTSISRDSRPYHVFKGIPYAKVETRFGMSKPIEGWDGLLKAHDSGPGCINSGFWNGKVTGIEDCLTLDVYTPMLPSNRTTNPPLPVMVWIYGGGWHLGANHQFSGSYFMDTDIVLVIPNYRVGVLGFLNAGVSSARGNQGLKDQVLALRWVQENIGQFSGDKNVVTLFGESAGAISTSLHTLSPMSKGLFHRAIMQSGTAINPFRNVWEDGIGHARRLGVEFDCPTSNMEYLVQCLQRIDPRALGTKIGFMNELGYDDSSLWLGPSVESYRDDDHDESNVFMSGDSYKLALEGKFHKVPITIGVNAFECYPLSLHVTNSPELTQRINKQWGRVGPRSLYLSKTADDPPLMANAIRSHFLHGQDINTTTLLAFESMNSDRCWVHPMRIMASLYSKHVPVFVYNFTQQIPVLGVNGVADFNKRRPAGHGDEFPYLFEMHSEKMESALGLPRIKKDSVDYKFSQSFVSTWAAFAKNGKPTGPWGEWTSFGETDKIMLIRDNGKLVKVPKSWEKNNEFWNSLDINEYGRQGSKWTSTHSVFTDRNKDEL